MSGHWNYRVIEHVECGITTMQIHEVYYDSEGKPSTLTVNAVCPLGETLEELKADVENYNKAMNAPVLKASDFE